MFIIPYLDYIANGIVLIAAVLVAINQIYNILHHSVTILGKNHKDNKEHTYIQFLDRVLPNYYSQYSEKTFKEINEQEKKRYSQVDKQFEDVNQNLAEIKDINLNQNSQIDKMVESLKDIIRHNIMYIYEKHRVDEVFCISDRERLEELYKDYKKHRGNSYIDKYYNRMCQWEVYSEDEYEKFKEEKQRRLYENRRKSE